MEEYVRESIDVMDEDIFKGSYDKEWALKEQGKWEGREEGIKEGIKEGMKEGVQQERRKNAKAMKENNIDIKVILKCTGLSIEEIEKL